MRLLARTVACLTSLALVCVVSQSRAQDTLASMQSSVITSRDLLQRLELMPWPGKEQPSQRESMAMRALNALVAEKVLAAEFDRLGLEETQEIQRLRHGLENVLLRDLLYRTEVSSKVQVTPEEIRVGLGRYLEEREVVVFQVKSEVDAALVAEHVENVGQDKDKIRAYSDSLVIRSASAVVRYGSMEEPIEHAAYGLTRAGDASPVRSVSDGWLVVALLDRRSNEEAALKDPAERRRTVERILRARKESQRATSFYYGYLSEQSAYADSAAFESIATALEKQWEPKGASPSGPREVFFTSGMVDRLTVELNEHLDAPLVYTSEGSISLGSILEQLRYEEFSIASPDPLRIRLELNERVKAMAANELLAREARRRGYHRRDEIRRDIRVWDDYWKSRRLFDVIVDSIEVSDEDMLRYMLSRRDVFDDRFEVNVREMLTRTGEEMKAVLTSLAGGGDLGAMARMGSARSVWADSGGVSGFFPIGDHPEIGYRALLATIGDLTGPIELPEGHSLFITLAKRVVGGRDGGVDSFRVQLRERLLGEKRRSTLARYVQGLARQEGVRIDADAVSNVPVSSINMFTRRYLGFGGIMTAVPMLSSQWDWLMQLGSEIRYLP